jgi:phosphoglycerate kinase
MLVIMGGAKLSTKLPIITHFLNSGARVFLGGAMAHPILKKRGLDIKNSLTEEIELGDDIINHKNLLLPIDYIWESKDDVERILDAGEETLKNIGLEINRAESIMWNGPIGMYEMSGFEFGTKELLLKLNNLDKFIVTGGGDTLSAIEKLLPAFKCSYKSLSGGAMLEYLAKGSLVGIEANK